MDVINLPHNCVPLKYENGKDFCMVHPEESIDTLCFVFKLGGDYETINMDAISDYFRTWKIDHTKFHVVERALRNEKTKMIRTLYVRLYRNEDFACHEHPEMLLGQPLGMYHCGHCGDMQMAGMMHLPPEPEWMPPAGTERGVIENVQPALTEDQIRTRELYHDAQLLDDADGRKMGDSESLSAEEVHAKWKAESKAMYDANDEYEPDA